MNPASLIQSKNSSHYSSIARSLLCVLDDDCRYPTVVRNTVQPRSASTHTQPKNISVVPTVTADHLQITNINVGKVLLYDVTGALRHEEAVDTNATMDISHLTAGIYVLVYTEAGTDYIESVKIVKL